MIENNQDEHLHLEGQYLVFGIGKEKYGLKISRIQEIMGAFEPTPVPNTRPDIKGIINLRGKIITVVDLRSRLNMTTKELTPSSCYIVISTQISDQPTTIAVLVDYVDEVVKFNTSQIEHYPDFGINESTKHLLGIGKTSLDKNAPVSLLDIDSLFT